MASKEAKRLAEAMAKLVPYIPVFKTDPMAKIDIKARDIDQQVKNYNRRFKSWKDLVPFPEVPNKVWLSVWKSKLTDDALDVLEKLTFEPTEEADCYELVSKKLLEHLTNKRGSKYTARVQFRSLKQAEKEPFAAFMQRLRSAATPCRWTDTVKNENMIEQLIAGHRDERVRAILFDLDTDELDKYVKKCEALEIASIQAANIQQPSSSNAHAVDSNFHRGNPYGRGNNFRGRGQQLRGRGLFRRGGFGSQNKPSSCGWCGGAEHGTNNCERTSQCKARNYVCQSCGCKGHYERCCRNTAAALQGQQSKHGGSSFANAAKNYAGKQNTHELSQQQGEFNHEEEEGLLYPEDDPDGAEEGHALTDEELRAMANEFRLSPNPNQVSILNKRNFKRKDFLKKLAKLGRPRAWYEEVEFPNNKVRMKVDSGSSVNTLPWNACVRLGITKEQLAPTTATLVSYSQHVIVPLGMIKFTIKLRGRKVTDWFMVLKTHGVPLLGLGAARALGLFNVGRDSNIQYKTDNENRNESHELGVHKEPVDIQLRPDAKPVNIPSRRIPIRLKTRVEATLKNMLEQGVIRPVNHPTEWCHPMLATDKKQKNGKVRVCIDPKYLNPSIKRPMYQLPDIDSLLGELGEARLFATLDLESGFWQVPVTERTSELLTFSTPYGRFQYLRLPFGIASAPEEFHRRVVEAMAGISGVLVYIDDIVIFAKTQTEHDEIVARVLKALADAGFKVNKAKCAFSQTRIKFLGHVIENGKILPDPDKIEAIRNFPVPKNQKELRAYIGLIGWIRKFRSDLMICTSIFRPLLRDTEPFLWTEDHSKAMAEINRKVSDNLALEVFRPGESLELWTDASPYGYGAILLQNQRPLFCASRSLTKAEKNYPQIDLELGAIAWAFERLDTYVYGANVKVCTDHKPLVTLAKKQIGDLSMRQQRMFARLMRYDFSVEYVSEKLMSGPDALSRAPQQLKVSDERPSLPRNPVAPDGDYEDLFISELQKTDLSDPLIARIQQQAKLDGQYQDLIKATLEGFPASTKTKIGEYWSVREGLYVAENLVFRDRELIVPRISRQMVLKSLHQAHQGVRAMERRAKGNVFWPNLKADIRRVRETCSHCQETLPSQQKQPMMSIEVPTAPGLAVASDYFQTQGKEYVLFVDIFSSWTEYFRVNSRRPDTLIEKFRQFMSRNGVPRVLYADKGSSYDSFEFKKFCEDWGIKLITCSGEYPQGNGTAEAAVKRVKKWILGAENESDLTKAILAWHQTPIASGRPTPAQIHLGRNLRDEIQTRVEQNNVCWDDVQKWRSFMKASNAKIYDKTAKELADIPLGSKVFVQVHGKWRRATLEQKAERPRSYVLKLSDTGARIERNRVHVRVDKTNSSEPDHLLYFFSAEEDRRTVSRTGSAQEDVVINDAGEPNEELPRVDEDPGQTTSKKKPRQDRERLYLEKQQTTKFGRQTKKVVPFDPFWN